MGTGLTKDLRTSWKQEGRRSDGETSGSRSEGGVLVKVSFSFVPHGTV